MKLKGWVTLAFGVWVIIGGVLRYLEQPDNPKGLYFGLFSGVIALVGAVFLLKEKRIVGYIFAGIAILFVGGFFASQLPKGGNYTSVRVLITLAASVINLIVLLLPAQKAAAAELTSSTK